MNVYAISANTADFDTLLPASEDYDETHGDILCKGSSLKKQWPFPLAVEAEGNDKPIGDFSYMFAGSLVLSERVVLALGEEIAASGELLPLSLNEKLYWLLNVTQVIDALLWMQICRDSMKLESCARRCSTGTKFWVSHADSEVVE